MIEDLTSITSILEPGKICAFFQIKINFKITDEYWLTDVGMESILTKKRHTH
ncbi:hypothetical protein [Flavobacterium sp. WC2416]|uniref:Uncharacterized protein n=1 Tax=Flavobacterium sp. WC2416 TaxID=3234141 RepID=A0AB39WDT1_9FLAO